jgi:predicted nucleic acid-binding protein
MILLDTNVLVALVDDRDSLHARAIEDWGQLAGETFVTVGPVIAEACFLLPTAVQRQKLRTLIERMPVVPVGGEADRLWRGTFEWMEKYAEHEPDWTDAVIAVMSGRERGMRVWTYDREFWTIWRRPDGTGIPMAV